jgi:queuine tRNA-ribosyltransferase
MMAFDECTYYPATHEYAAKANKRTHEWLIRCIAEHKRSGAYRLRPNPSQYLYGIIQGGQYEDLRKESAGFVSKQDTDGVAIGGVSVGESKEEMRNQVKWCQDFLPDDKPVHLLGIGQFDDFVDLVTAGIDTFDCVEPSRLARIGVLYQWREPLPVELDINKTAFKADFSPVDENCDCYTCQNFTKSYLCHLFKQRELLAYSLATFHNIYSMERFMKDLRNKIGNDLI